MIFVLIGAVILATVALPSGARRMARLGAPTTAMRWIAVASVALTVGAIGLLAEVFGVAIAETHPVAGWGGWSGEEIEEHLSVPPTAAAVVALAVLWAIAAGIGFLARDRRDRRTLRAYVGRLITCDGLAVVTGSRAPAFAAPVAGGVVVVDEEFASVLTPAERRAVLAHERAHLRGRHHLYLRAATACSAVNPLLRGVVPALALAAERAADQEAVTELGGDVRVLARALSKASAFARPGAGAGAPALAVTGAVLPGRVAALLSPAPVARPRLALVLLVLSATLGALAPLVVAVAAHGWLEAAQAALPSGR